MVVVMDALLLIVTAGAAGLIEATETRGHNLSSLELLMYIHFQRE